MPNPQSIIQTFTFRGETARIYTRPGSNQAYWVDNPELLDKLKAAYPDYRIGADGQIYARGTGQHPQPIGGFRETQILPNGNEVPYTRPATPQGSTSQGSGRSTNGSNSTNNSNTTGSQSSSNSPGMTNQTHVQRVQLPDVYQFDSNGVLRDGQGNQIVRPQGRAAVTGIDVGNSRVGIAAAEDGSVWMSSPNGRVLRFDNADQARAYVNAVSDGYDDSARIERILNGRESSPNGQQSNAPDGVAAPEPTSTLRQRMKENPMALMGLVGGGAMLFGIGYAMMQLPEGQSKFAYLMGSIPGFMGFVEGASSLLKLSMQNSLLLGAGIMLLGTLLGKKKGDDKKKTDQGDAPALGAAGTTQATSPLANTGPKPWYKELPANNVFMITAAAALLAIGLNLGMNGPTEKFIPTTAVKLLDTRNALDAATGGGKLPAIGTSVLGKVFVYSAQNNGMSNDKVVYVSDEGVDSDGKPQYMINMLSLNYDGKVISQYAPNASSTPFFMFNTRGAIVASPEGNAALGRVRALSLAASSNQTSPEGAAGAAGQNGANHP